MGLTPIHAMKPSIAVRVTGGLILVILFLIIVILQLRGVKNLIESLSDIFILIVGVLGTLAIELIIWPEKFLSTSKELRESKEKEIIPSANEHRKYRFDIKKEISDLMNELESQTKFPQHAVSRVWASERFEIRPLFFNPTEYQKIQDFYSKLDYWNQIVDNWNSQMKQEHDEFWSYLKKHCLNSGKDALRDIVW